MTPRVEVTIDAETLKQNPVCLEILQVLKIVRPAWQAKNIQQRILPGGITNQLFAYFIKGKFDDDVVLFRIEGEGTEHLVNRKQEEGNLQTLYAAGIGPLLYCIFNNGIAYGYINGETLTIDTVREEAVRRYKFWYYPHGFIRLICRKNLTSIDVQPWSRRGIDIEYSTLCFARNKSISLPGIERTPNGVKATIYQLLELAPDGFPDNPEKHKRYTDNLPPKSDLKKEVEELWNHLENLNSPVMFCHNDLLPANIIYNREKGSVHFIDYEFAMYNYEHFDIGMHFFEYTGLHHINLTRYPDRPYQLEWLRYYLECKAEQDGGSPEDVKITDIDECYVIANKFALVCTI